MDLSFKEISVGDQPAINKFIARCKSTQSDYSVATLLLWTDFTEIGICITDEAVYIKGKVDDELVFFSPLCDLDYYPTAVANLIEYCTEQDELFRMIYAVRPQIESLLASEGLSDGEIAEKMAQQQFETDNFCLKNERSMAEYVYLPSTLIELSGQKLQSKKNRVSLFHRTYDGRYELRPMTDNDIDGIKEMTISWNRLKGYDYHEELNRLMELIENREMLGIEMHLLLIDGAIVGMTMFQRLVNGVGVVLFEKCDSAHILGFAALNQYAAKCMSDCRYVNRQEDLGLPGLRQSKLTFQPAFLEEKFTLTANLKSQILPLYQRVFGDSDELINSIFCDSLVPFTALSMHLGNVVACGFVRHKKLRAFGHVTELPYLFGIATAPEYRGQGRAKNVIKNLLCELNNNKYPIAMLCPAEHWLYDYYGKLGFIRFNFNDKVPLHSVLDAQTALRKGTEADSAVVTALFNGHNEQFTIAQYRDEDDTSTRLNELFIDGGSLVVFSRDGKDYGYAMIDENGEVEEVITLAGETSTEKMSEEECQKAFDALGLDGKNVVNQLIEVPKSEPLSQVDIDSDDTHADTMVRVVNPQVLMEKLVPFIRTAYPLDINFKIHDPLLRDSVFNLKTNDEKAAISYDMDASAPSIDMDVRDLVRWLLGKITVEGLPSLLGGLTTSFYEEY